MPRPRLALLAVAALLAASCASAPAPGEKLWSALTPHCGQAYVGMLVEGTDPSDADGASLDFSADAFTARLIPRAATNIWTLAVEPQRGFSYGLRREESGRRFRLEFDFGKPAPAQE